MTIQFLHEILPKKELLAESRTKIIMITEKSSIKSFRNLSKLPESRQYRKTPQLWNLDPLQVPMQSPRKFKKLQRYHKIRCLAPGKLETLVLVWTDIWSQSNCWMPPKLPNVNSLTKKTKFKSWNSACLRHLRRISKKQVQSKKCNTVKCCPLLSRGSRTWHSRHNFEVI